MAKIEFKGVQKQAIETRDTNILVSAGAGSGKTTVLVERIMRMVLSGNIHINRLLVVTHTKAAATQMKDKIADALNKAAKADPNNENLRKQLALINKANITTVSSFCLAVARRFFHKIDMDPSFRAADEAEISLLKTQVVDDLLEDYFLGNYVESPNPDFIHLADFFDQKPGHEYLRKAVLDLHKYSLSAPNPKEWLKGCVAQYQLADGLENTAWHDYFTRYAEETLSNARENCHNAISLAMEAGSAQKYLDVLGSDLEMLSIPETAFSGDFDRFYSWKHSDTSEEAKEMRERAKNIRDTYKKSVADLQEMLTGGKGRTVEKITQTQRSVQLLVDLTTEFARRFAEEKKTRNIADFSDFEHFALQILVDNLGNPTPEAMEIGASFDEVFVDEYQDSNLMQEALLSAVAGAGGIKRFMVGDVKQCIYQFRLARPQIFSDKNAEYGNNSSDGVALPLTENFRSRRGVIDSVNYIFDKLMSPNVGGVAYDMYSRLQFAANFEDNKTTDLRSILHIVGAETDEGADEASQMVADLNQAEMEATTTAQHITQLFDNNFQVYEDKKWRNIKYSDIVILLRGKAEAQVFIDQLKNRNIPAFSGEEDNEYFLATEVMTILSILQIIDNPRQDIALITALFSDIFRFNADDLIQMSKNRGKDDFYTAITRFANESDCPLSERVREFLSTLHEWRKMAGFMPISQLIFALYQMTDYYNFVGLLAGGKLRRANLTLLFEKAARFEEGSFGGLFNFIRYIEKLQKTNFGLKKARTEDENADVVSIMTIHKSKGLEFPVVFLCQLGKQFYTKDTSEKMVLDYDLGIGLKLLDENTRTISETFPRAVISQKMRAEKISEEMRILYVAMTRAKEKLILIGGSKKPDKYHALQGGPSVGDVSGGKSFMDWILMALGGNPDKSIWDIMQTDAGHIRQEEASKQRRLANVFDNLIAGEVDGQDHLAYEYAHSDAQFVPAKMSVSEVKRLYFNEFIRESDDILPRERREFPPPTFMVKDDKIDSAGRGIIMHTLLEHMDINAITAGDVASLVARLVAQSLLTAEETEVVQIPPITAFLNSPLAKRMRKADKIQREIPFAVNMPAGLINSSFRHVDGDMLIHGVIDCCFEENGKMVIVDYKTERVKGDVGGIVEKYRPQMELYHQAVEKIFSQKVGEKIMYFFDTGQAIVI
ncbi:MAG: helicase-exonuclease AddAB subunit AddA [Defluviitaleaceae bacterium]|nr:helicase-exonuclease AddAB subunit AddA [Defluviitaleaceae bacterium]